LLIILPLLLMAFFQNSPDRPPELLYKSEGVLGQVKVAEFIHEKKRYRGLFVNGTLQTVRCESDPSMHYWAYTRMLDEIIGILPRGEDALLLGMAGGTLVESLQEAGFTTDVVDIDPRMEHVARAYFAIKLSESLIADDARHFINTSTDTYDLVIFDTFHGESVPTHIVTRESLQKLATMIRPEGLAIINFYGFEHGEEGKISHALFQTLQHEGWEVMVLATPGQERSRNLEFLITRSDTLLTGIADRYFREFPQRASSDRTYDFEEAVQLPSDRLISDEFSQGPLYNHAAKAWRELYRERRRLFSHLPHE
jgi:spermidine synthase